MLPAVLEGGTLPAVRRQLRDGLDGVDRLVVDCREVVVLSRSGQAVLVATSRLASARHVPLRYVNPTPVMRAVLGASGLAHLLDG